VFTVDAGLDASIPDASPFDADISDASDIDATVGCGDGVIDPGNDEDCDDFNTGSNDGCSDQCTVETGFICVSEPSECHTPPGPGELIITEILKDPDAVNDPEGEWFEIFNPTAETFQLLNMIIMDDGGEQKAVDSPLTIGPSQTLVFGTNADMGTNGGVMIDFAYLDIEFVLANNNDEIVLLEPFGLMQIDRVDYRDATFPDTTGSSLSLSGSAYSPISNNIGANWCDGQTSFGAGDLGTPGVVNPDC
jgi:cysteine-rich repeat protein